MLVQPVVLIVLVEALLPLDFPLLHAVRLVPLPLLRGAADGSRPRRRRARSGDIDTDRLPPSNDS
jgi:hypothetical protein